MSEPQRAATPPEGSPVEVDDRDRSSRIEQLLLAGLDLYFAGQYEQAIDVWTRVAFLERRHGPARAYIDRARGALAERQRESEELVDSGRAAYEAGDWRGARRLLTEAVARGGGGDTATLLLERLDRVAVPHAPGAVVPSRPSPTQASQATPKQSWLPTVVAIVLVVATVLVVGRMVAATVVEWGGRTATAPPHIDPLPVVGLGELALQRGRRLHADGRLAEAIDALAQIDIADPDRPAADELRAVWQRQALAEGGGPSPSVPGRQP
ncbi:MAG TPA: hypothetical protein VIY56_00415 [Vicinamibacterales bacterium]